MSDDLYRTVVSPDEFARLIAWLDSEEPDEAPALRALARRVRGA